MAVRGTTVSRLSCAIIMVVCMLAKKPAERCSAAHLLQHPFMRGHKRMSESAPREELITALSVKDKGHVEVHRIVEAVHRHQRLKRDGSSPKPPQPSSSSPVTSSASNRWRSLRSSLGVSSATACKTTAASKLATTWEAVVNLAHSLDVPREQLIRELLD